MIKSLNHKPIIIDSPKFSLGESPVWWTERGLFVFTDILDKKICFLDPQSLKTQVITTPESVVCIVPCDDKRLLLAMYMKICIFDYEKKLIEDIYEAKKTEVGLRFNDGKCDSNGRFWISGIGNEEEKINSSIFIFSKKNSCHIKKRNQILLGNGLGWNKHKSSFYFTDSKKQQILLFSYYKDPIQMESQNSVFFESKQKGHEPDGLYVDKNGYVWSCIWDAGEILRINPDGKVELKIKLPISRPTSLTFGGAMLDIMLVTTAMSNENSSKLNHLHEGKCFMYKSMPYGLPTQNFKL